MGFLPTERTKVTRCTALVDHRLFGMEIGMRCQDLIVTPKRRELVKRFLRQNIKCRVSNPFAIPCIDDDLGINQGHLRHLDQKGDELHLAEGIRVEDLESYF